MAWIKKRWIKLTLFSVLIGWATMQGCQSDPPTISKGFYYWKTEAHTLRGMVQDLVDEGYQTLYLHLFDVDWNGGQQIPIPVGISKTDILSFPSELQIIPVVFITNQVFLNASESQLSPLADSVYQFIEKMAAAFPYQEIQIDCDWTQRTKQSFFSFLEFIRARAIADEKILSATIRLHQIKYAEKTGVPPVDRGMLMCYNVGEVSDWETSNSILITDQVRQYLKNSPPYPLELDVALPVFNWAVLFRDGEFHKLIHPATLAHFQDTSQWQAITSTRFVLKKNSYFEGHYLYKGDRVRLEQSHPDEVAKVAAFLGAKLPKNDKRTVFFHLDSLVFKQFPHARIENIVRHFQK